MASYDEAIIQKFANKLYGRARSIVLMYAFLGWLMRAIGGALLFAPIEQPIAGLLAGGVVLALCGFYFGQARAFNLRLQAQQALCQVQIEINTRRSIQANVPSA